MENYEGFAPYYDLFMEQMPYDDWVKQIESIWRQQEFTPSLVAELGCGTGNITLRLAQKGIDMIGIDCSEEMLAIAAKKWEKQEPKGSILFLLQDMRELELYGTVSCILSLCDSINYITDKQDLKKVFSLVNQYLDPGGLFLFDINTAYYFQSLGDQTFAQMEDSVAYVWENHYDAKENRNEYALTFFVQTSASLYRRLEEIHYERAYSVSEIKDLLTQCGLTFLSAYDSATMEACTSKSKRILITAKKMQKEATYE